MCSTADSIEANVEQGSHRVVEGNKQLVKAIKHQVIYIALLKVLLLFTTHFVALKTKTLLLSLVYSHHNCHHNCNCSDYCVKSCWCYKVMT